MNFWQTLKKHYHYYSKIGLAHDLELLENFFLLQYLYVILSIFFNAVLRLKDDKNKK
ncbi:hypothetical protein KDN24_21205 [Bacillus sp. Bva_UNVM-123]|uniref:hypothetical protein n=1 Tax=Bacillus sp. Bva_UNVM-123 TaxID=2829798 RepID=UPI00391F7AB8